MVVIGTGSLQGTPCSKQCTKPSLQRAPVSRRRIVALAAPSTKHRPAAEEREEQHSSSSYVEAGRTAEAVRSFDDGAQSRGFSVQSAANLVRNWHQTLYGTVRWRFCGQRRAVVRRFRAFNHIVASTPLGWACTGGRCPRSHQACSSSMVMHGDAPACGWCANR